MNVEAMSRVAARIQRRPAPTPSFGAEPPEWMASALCAQIDPDLWFPEKGHPSNAAKALCEGCPVKLECLEYGMNDQHGIYGGLSARERLRLRNGRAA